MLNSQLHVVWVFGDLSFQFNATSLVKFAAGQAELNPIAFTHEASMLERRIDDVGCNLDSDQELLVVIPRCLRTALLHIHTQIAYDCEVEFVEAPGFTTLVSDYLDDDEYRGLQVFLAGKPDAGDVIPGTGGFRKLRWGDPRRGKGKRGGLRVIYYYLEADDQIWLITVYDKDEMADLSPAEKRLLKKAIEAELTQRAGRRSRRRKEIMAAKRRYVARKKRSLFREMMSGVQAMRDHREGRVTLKTKEVHPITVPPIDAETVRETREALNMSRQVFAFKIGVNPRTLERWEQGRSKPNEQAAALLWLVRKYPDTLKRLESLAASA